MFSCAFAIMFFAVQSPILALDDVGVVEGRIINVLDPVNDQDVATKNYVDNSIDMLTPPPAILQTLGQSTTAVMSQKAVTDSIWPVGSVYISVNLVNPATLFGGIWEQIQNTFLLAAGSLYSANTTGGNQSVSLTTSNMPNHTHSFSATTGSGGSHTHDIGRDYDGGSGSSRYTVHYQGTSGAGGLTATSSAGSHTHSVSGTTDSTGSGSSFSIMPPYLAVYMWKRLS